MDVPGDIQGRYVERRKKDLENCRLSLERGNFMELEKVGHQLKGNGVTFGFDELSAIGRQMEKAAHTKNLPDLERALELFSQWVSGHIN